MNNYDVIVIGGGAAGMFAAIQAGYAGAKVLLLEPNDRLSRVCSWPRVGGIHLVERVEKAHTQISRYRTFQESKLP